MDIKIELFSGIQSAESAEYTCFGPRGLSEVFAPEVKLAAGAYGRLAARIHEADDWHTSVDFTLHTSHTGEGDSLMHVNLSPEEVLLLADALRLAGENAQRQREAWKQEQCASGKVV